MTVPTDVTAREVPSELTAAPPADGDDSPTVDIGRRRFTVAVVVGLFVVTVPYLWILWDLWTGGTELFRLYTPANFYDVQARAILAGHLYVPQADLGIEAFLHNGRAYTYFGVFPSLLRLPVLVLTHRFDGRLTAPSMLLAWVVTGVTSSLLLWRVRVLVRGAAIVSRAEAVCSGLVVATITGGSVLVFLAAAPKVADEDMAWSVALTIASLFALLGVLERPSRWRVVVAGLVVLAAALDRSPTGYACALASLLVAGWFAWGRAGAGARRWAVPMGLIGLGALAANGLIAWAKLGSPFGLSEANQVWTHVNAHRHLFLAANGGSAFGLQFLPSTLRAYLLPTAVHFQSAFPYVTLPTVQPPAVGKVILDETYPTFSIPASMPLFFVLACWGLVTCFRPGSVGRVRLCRLLLIAAAAGTAGVLVFGYIANRYLGDFLPFLLLAGCIGLVDVWRRLDGKGRVPRVLVTAAIAAGAVFGIWANVGSAVIPSSGWTPAQSQAFVARQFSLNPGATASLLRTGSRLPYFAPAGTLFAADGCAALYVSTGISYATVPGQQLEHDTWDPVEQGPGINSVAEVEYHRTVQAGDPPLTVLTWGKTSVELVPSGVDNVRTVVVDPGGPNEAFPPTATGPQAVSPGTPFRIEVTTDPYLQMIVAGGLGQGVEHFLAGTGPAVVHVSTGPGSGTGATVQDVTPPAPSMALCRTLVRAAAGHAG